MKNTLSLSILLLLTSTTLDAKNTAFQSNETTGKQQDSIFFAQKRKLLTATWSAPFSYNSIKSNHAPLGPYMGNGDIGIVCSTSPNGQTLHISKVDFVTDGWSNWAGSGPSALPVGGVSIQIEEQETTTGFCYEMDQLGNELRMTTATAQPIKMKSWVAVDENLIVTELKTTSSQPVRVHISTYADSTNASIYTRQARVDECVAQITRQTKTTDVRWISQAGISTVVLGASSKPRVVSTSKVEAFFTITVENPVYVVTCVSGGGMKNDAKLAQASQRLKTLDTESLTKVEQRKKAWWKDMWHRSYVETNDDLLNRHYLSSIYLLASAYNRHSPVCGGMYGVWNMDDDMMYHGDIHLNYNSQAGFYSVFSANRPEIAMPFFQFIESIVPDGKERAKNDLGILDPSLRGKSCRGVLFLVGGLGIGVPYNYYWKQTMNAPFNVPLFSWYYEYTGDVEFLRKRAYPFILECGNFYEDFMKKEKYGNTYRYTITTGAHEDSWDLNPPSDLAFVEQTFSLLLKYSKILGVDKSRRALWHDILTHLPTYKVVQPTKSPNKGLPVFAKNEEGWDSPSHMIQMHAVYPCEVLNIHSASKQLEIARNTIEYYQVSQNGFTETMNELGLSAFVMAARVNYNPELVVDKMKTLIARAKPNFLIVDGHHCTEKTTPIETINSMMLQAVDGVLYLFPSWIKSPASFTRLRTKGAFLVSADYDGSAVSNLTVYSEKGGVCKLKNPWQDFTLSIIETKNGRTTKIQSTVKDGIYTFSTRKGATYSFDLLKK